MFLLNPAAILQSIPYVAIVALVMGIYFELWAIPHAAREARTGYVAEATLAAAEATTLEVKRQLAVATDTAATFRAALKSADEGKVRRDAETNTAIADYERTVFQTKQACGISDADLELLKRRHRP